MTTAWEKIAEKLLRRHATRFEFVGEDGVMFVVEGGSVGPATDYEDWLIMRVDVESFFLVGKQLAPTTKTTFGWAKYSPVEVKIATPDEGWDLVSCGELEDAVLLALAFADGERTELFL